MEFKFSEIRLDDFVEEVMLQLSPFLPEGGEVHFDLTVGTFLYKRNGGRQRVVVIPPRIGSYAETQKISFTVQNPIERISQHADK